jgi:ABC-type multidrug transport system ATPase subunit
VAGFDVAERPAEVRRRIGLSGQYAAVDPFLTGRENLIMIGRLYGLTRRQARSRAGELIGQLELTGAAGRLVRTYSGGMRRRLDVAASLLAAPPVLFLDEPTTGLDPYGRLALWQILGDLTAQGISLLLTTQYIEEAERLAGMVVIIDHGKVIASGTPDQLKDRAGGGTGWSCSLRPARTRGSWQARSRRLARENRRSMSQRGGSSCLSQTGREFFPTCRPGWPPPVCTSAGWLCAGPRWRRHSWPSPASHPAERTPRSTKPAARPQRQPSQLT